MLSYSGQRRLLLLMLLLGVSSSAGCARVSSRPSPAQARWLLSYDGDPRFSYSIEDYRALISGGRFAGECRNRQLFTGVILLALQSQRSGRWFAEWMPGAKRIGVASSEDAFAYLRLLASPEGPLRKLDQAARDLGLKAPLEVAVMVPHDLTADQAFAPSGISKEQRLQKSISAHGEYIDSLVATVDATRYAHLRLRAVYWLTESIADEDTALVRGVARSAHESGLAVLWIPYFRAQNVGNWAQLGIDVVWLQPNYFFDLSLGPDRIRAAEERAVRNNMGIEVEFDWRLLTDARFAGRLGPYLEAISRMGGGSVAVYDGAGTLGQLLVARRPEDVALARSLVETICRHR